MKDNSVVKFWLLSALRTLIFVLLVVVIIVAVGVVLSITTGNEPQILAPVWDKSLPYNNS